MVSVLIKRFCSSASPSFSDFIICGGGLIGCTVASTLAKQGCFSDKTVTLIEANPINTLEKSTTYSNRVSAISPFSKDLFERLGIWKNVHRFKTVRKLKIFGIYSDNFLELDNNGDAVAYIVENNALIQAISEELKILPNVKIIHGKNIASVNIKSDLPSVILDDGSKYNCHLLIGSDGFNSKVREAMDVHYLSWNYKQMGVVATLKISDASGENNVAWQKFLPDGPIALLPLSNDLSSLVWSTTKEKAQNLLNIPEDNFIDALNNSLTSKINPNQLTQYTNKGVDSLLSSLGLTNSVMTYSDSPPMVVDILEKSRAAFPLGFGHSAQYISPHVVLIGDAAHRVHPLAGQGVNLGFKDITFLEHVLTEGYKNGRELGDVEDLKKYETLCQLNNVPVMTFIELIHRVYTSEFGISQTVGDVSLKLANSLGLLKDQINKNALFLRS